MLSSFFEKNKTDTGQKSRMVGQEQSYSKTVITTTFNFAFSYFTTTYNTKKKRKLQNEFQKYFKWTNRLRDQHSNATRRVYNIPHS